MPKNDQELFITAGKKSREELRLPTLHFVVADDWIGKMGEKTFCYWLKLLTLVDRTDEAKSKYGNHSTVPRSLENLAELFNMSKSTFYRNVIHPLWNYGFIDLVEWEDSTKLGQKPINIIVYDYPQNSYELAIKPLEKCRDYKTQYNSNSAIFGRIGGQLRKDENKAQKEIKPDRLENETVNDLNRFKSKTVNEMNDFSSDLGNTNGFKNETVDGFKNKTVSVLKMKPINDSNTIINDSNIIINDSNTYLNSSSSLNIEKYDDEVINLKEKEEEEMNEINSYTIDFLKNELKYSDYIVSDIVKHMKLNGLNTLTKKQMLNQARRIDLWISENKKEIREFGYFFITGILKHEPSRSILDREKELKKLQEKRKEAGEIKNFIQMYFELNGNYPTQEEIENRDYSRFTRKIPFYNWLES